MDSHTSITSQSFAESVQSHGDLLLQAELAYKSTALRTKYTVGVRLVDNEMTIA
jgi:hypothetical protein